MNDTAQSATVDDADAHYIRANTLFDRNRFNVAISRARAATVLVCSPRLLDIRCRTPDQMALANLLCAFSERAKPGLAQPQPAG